MPTTIDTPFRDMSDQQRERWINWCFRHDWCVSAGQDGCRSFFVEDTSDEQHTFATPRALRDWAGY